MILLKVLTGTVIFFLAVPFLFSQTGISNQELKLKSSFVTPEIIQQDTVNDVRPFRMKKSPWGAVIRSAILPGFGQFYNESYWKIPVIALFMGYFGYEFIDNHNQYRDYRDQYAVSQTPENPAGNNNLKLLREFYRDQRDEFLWYLGIVYLINLVDAYVDAHLFDFDVSEEPITSGGKKFQLKFNLLYHINSF